MILSTSRLFAKLLRPLGINFVCDVGSLNGADALRFRRALPRAEIIAFEPNPENYDAMRDMTALQRAGIVTLPYAAAACDGEADFYVVPVDGPGNLARRGMSSLHQRSAPDQRGQPVTVTTRRLDGVLAGKLGDDSHLALWIDAEGTAYEVLLGAAGVLDRVRLVHVEVETEPCIGARQKLYADVAALLRERGFIELATDYPLRNSQFNALYLRGGLPAPLRAAVWRRKWIEQVRRWLVEVVLAVCPPRLRRYLRRRRLMPAAVTAAR